MATKDTKQIVVSKVKTKKGTAYVIYDKLTHKPLCHVMDKPTYHHFDLEDSFLSGIGSAFNIPGNYYTFQQYLQHNDDASAIASDWQKVGAALWDAMSY